MSCPDCFSGHTHTGIPRGREAKLYGLDVYVVYPPAEDKPIRGTIVIIPGVLGWEFVNARLLADHYADRGAFRVLLPDFMNGKPAPPWILSTFHSLMFGPWYTKPYHLFWALVGVLPFVIRNRPSKAFPGVAAFFTALRSETLGFSSTSSQTPAVAEALLPPYSGVFIPGPVGAAGFCWGGKLIALLSDPILAPPVSSPTSTTASSVTKSRKALIDAAFLAHPSMLSLPAEIERMQVPAAFAIGVNDHALPAKDVQLIRDALAQKPEYESGEVTMYEGAGHGFALRAEEGAEVEVRALEAEEQAVAWFSRWFEGWTSG